MRMLKRGAHHSLDIDLPCSEEKGHENDKTVYLQNQIHGWKLPPLRADARKRDRPVSSREETQERR